MAGQAISPQHVFMQIGGTTWDKSRPDGSPAPPVWENSPGGNFSVRIGPNYEKNHKKAPSKDAMYRLIGMDFIKHETNRVCPITPLFNTKGVCSPAAEAFSHPYVPRLFVLNVQVPDCPASLMSKKDDGPSVMLVAFFEITEETIKAMNDLEHAEPAHRLFAEWCKVCEVDKAFRSRFKIMGQVVNFDAVGLPSMLAGYNGKPTLISQSGQALRGKDNAYIEMGVNMHIFNYIARKSIATLKHKVKDLIVEFAATIEARSDEEMPERLIIMAKMSFVDVFAAPILEPFVQEWMQSVDALNPDSAGASS